MAFGGISRSNRSWYLRTRGIFDSSGCPLSREMPFSEETRTPTGMKEKGRGRVQYVASDSAVVFPAEMMHYGASKTGLPAVAR